MWFSKSHTCDARSTRSWAGQDDRHPHASQSCLRSPSLTVGSGLTGTMAPNLSSPSVKLRARVDRSAHKPTHRVIDSHRLSRDLLQQAAQARSQPQPRIRQLHVASAAALGAPRAPRPCGCRTAGAPVGRDDADGPAEELVAAWAARDAQSRVLRHKGLHHLDPHHGHLRAQPAPAADDERPQGCGQPFARPSVCPAACVMLCVCVCVCVE
jgi:hypothetical protein